MALSRTMSLMLIAATLATGAVAQTDPAPQVRAPAGTVEGTSDGAVTAFKGIPYAQPPIGPLRWRAPQPLATWKGVRKAVVSGPNCMQKDRKDNGIGPGPSSEDCLTLNVYKPATAGTAKLPVMVWIYGGGFMQGSSSAALYDGSELAKQGVIVVTLNYRVGYFGFFAHRALTAAAKGEPVANYGLMDQIAALKWVQSNIGAFGGDNRNVTIFGQSAGGMSVNSLVASPLARGLFQKAITQSGLGREQPQPLVDAEKIGDQLATKWGAPGASIAALRALPAKTIVDYPDLDLLNGDAPILDGKVVPKNVQTSFERGSEARIPMMIGTTDLELPKPWVPKPLPARTKIAPNAVDRLVALYGSRDAYDNYLYSDLLFVEPARHLALAHSSRAPVYFYRFGILSPKLPSIFKGTPHSGDQVYVFKTIGASAWPLGDHDRALMQDVSAYWVAFAKTGDPNGGDRPHWARFDGSSILQFTNDGPKAGADPSAARLDLLTSLYTPTGGPLTLGLLAPPAAK